MKQVNETIKEEQDKLNVDSSALTTDAQELIIKIANSVPVAVHKFRVAPNGEMSMPFSSPAVTDIYGMTPEALKDDFILALDKVHPDDREPLMAAVERSKCSMTPFQFEWRLNHPQKGEIWVACRSTPETEADGGTAWYGYFHDITELKSAERERLSLLRFFESMDRVNRAIQEAHDLERMMSAVLETLLSIFDCDRAWMLYPCDPGSKSWRVPMERTRPEYPGGLAAGESYPMEPGIANNMRLVLETGEPVSFGAGNDYPFAGTTANRFDIRSSMATALYPKIDKPWMFGLHQCRRTRVWSAEERRLFSEIGRRLSDGLTSLLVSRGLKESEQKFRQAFEFAGIGMGILTIDGSWLRANRTVCEMLGYSESKLRGMTFQELTHPDDLVRSNNDAQRVAAGYVPYMQMETRYRHRDGYYLWTKATTTVVRSEAGDPLYFVSQIEYIDERKRADYDIALMNFAVNRVAEGVYLMDDRARFKYVNDEACRVLGYSRDDLLDHMGVPDVDPDYDLARWSAHWEELRNKGSVLLETRHRTKTGDMIPVEVYANYFEYEGRGYNLALARDISERKRAERERLYHLRFFESLDRVNRAIQGATSLEQMMHDVLGTLLELMDCDRAWLLYPCDPDAETWHVPMELTRPEYPGLFAAGEQCPMDSHVARNMEILLQSSEPVGFGDGLEYPFPGEIPREFDIQSTLATAVYPKTGKAWMFGLHQCSYPRLWTPEERRLFSEVGRRLCDGLTSLLVSRDLHESEERFRQMADSIHEVFWLTDASKSQMLYVSPGYESIWGRSCQDLYADPGKWIDSVHPDDRDAVVDAVQHRQRSGKYDIEYRIFRPDGSLRHIHERAFPIRDADGRVYRIAGTAQDVTERKLHEAHIQYLAYHDALTGLPNRELVMNRLQQGIAQAQRHREMLAVLFLDLDRFKTINDTLGHLAGDQLLHQVAGCLTETLREEDTVGRVGGDEFLILLPELSSPEDAAHVTEKIIAGLLSPFRLEGHELHVNASVGISMFPRDAKDAETLVKYADSALYLAKEQGRNTFRFFSPELDTKVRARLHMENDLRGAIERNEFFLVYQPQINQQTGKFIGAETLLRWRHPVNGDVSPASFIPIAEETRLIVPIGEWVLRQACRQTIQWKQQGCENFAVSINLSRRQLEEKDFAAKVKSILTEEGCEPRFLEFEITESAAMSEPDQAIVKLRALHELGIQLAIDDFGTGYSSLAYLKRFPFDRLKIDQSFVSGIPDDNDDVAIVQTTIMLARQLRLKVIAEGVETEAQKKFLLENGCEEMQGYLFAKPMEAEEVEKLCRFWTKVDTL